MSVITEYYLYIFAYIFCIILNSLFKIIFFKERLPLVPRDCSPIQVNYGRKSIDSHANLTNSFLKETLTHTHTDAIPWRQGFSYQFELNRPRTSLWNVQRYRANVINSRRSEGKSIVVARLQDKLTVGVFSKKHERRWEEKGHALRNS